MQPKDTKKINSDFLGGERVTFGLSREGNPFSIDIPDQMQLLPEHLHSDGLSVASYDTDIEFGALNNDHSLSSYFTSTSSSSSGSGDISFATNG